MPQITLEYTNNIKDNVDFDLLFNELHLSLNTNAGINIANCKSRARKMDCYFIGNGGKQKSFVSLDIFLLEGRTDEIKKNLSNMALDLLKKYFPKSIAEQEIQITIRVEDMTRNSYSKYTTEGKSI